MSTPNFVGNSPSRPVGSLAQILTAVKTQVEYDTFDKSDKALAGELCLIISELFNLPSSAEIQIGQDKLGIDLVQQVYSMLTREHLSFVIDNFRACVREIKFKKAYMRTALYNSVFEYETYCEGLSTSYLSSKAVAK